MERLGLEEGEEILPGITVQADGGQSGNFRVLCDGQHDEGAVEAEEEVVEAVSTQALPVISPGAPTRASLGSPPAALAARDLTRRQGARLGGRSGGWRQLAHRRARRSSRRAARSWGTRCRDARRRAIPRPGSRPAPADGPAAMSRCIELPSVACAAVSSPSGSPLGIEAPSACATAQPSSIAPTSSARSSGVERISPSSLSNALVVQASALRRTSFDHITCGSESPTRAGMPASESMPASPSIGARTAGSLGCHLHAQELARVHHHARLGAIGLDADRARHDRALAEALAQHGDVVQAVEQRQHEPRLRASTRSSASRKPAALVATIRASTGSSSSAMARG